MSTSNAINASNMLRLTGLSSGLDTESMVTSLMKAENMRYDKLAQKKTLMDWQKEANLNVNNLLRSFRNTYLSSVGADSVLLPAAILARKVTMDASSSVTVTAGAKALEDSHTIDSITSLATGASAASAARISSGAISIDTKLSDLALDKPLDFTGGDISFEINGQKFTFTGSDTLSDIISTVNNNADANVQMSYSSLTGKISLRNKTLGSDSKLEIKNLTGNAFSAANSAFGIAEGAYTNGTDAVLKIDGVDVTQKSNSFTIDGVTYTLKGTTATAQKFSVEQDIDGAVDKIKKFVDAYNELIGKLDDIVSEDRDSDYQPLTDDQRAEMDDSQIEKWEAKAKSGLLHGDSNITSLLRDMRGAFYDKVAGAGASASSVGLRTISYLTKGAIQVDETKLREALKNNPQQVADIFTDTSSSKDASTKYTESGLTQRVLTSVNNYLNDYAGYRTESFNDQYKTLTDDMTNMQRILQDKEDRYWKQFTAMETALANMNAQSQWLSQQFSSSNS